MWEYGVSHIQEGATKWVVCTKSKRLRVSRETGHSNMVQTANDKAPDEYAANAPYSQANALYCLRAH